MRTESSKASTAITAPACTVTLSSTIHPASWNIGRNCVIRRTTTSPTTPMARLVATRASCLSDFTLVDTSPSADGRGLNFHFLGNECKELMCACTAVLDIPVLQKYGQEVTYRSIDC